MVKHPWVLTPFFMDYIVKHYPDEEERASVISQYRVFYDNNYLRPSIAGYLILGTFALLVVATPVIQTVTWLLSSTLYRRKDPAWLRRTKSRFIESPLFGLRRATPYTWAKGVVSFQVPSRMHTLVVAALLLVNVLTLCAFHARLPDSEILGDQTDQWVRTFSDRTSVLVMIHLPIVILLAGKSSPVALMTGISFSTQMLYHRWVARILLMLTIAHTVGWTVTEARADYYTETMSDPYIWWGFVGLAFFAMSSILSLTFLRHSCYEIFLGLHIVFAVMGLVGTYFHLNLMQENPLSDFFDFLWASCAFWVFDRVVRLGRVFLLNFGITPNGAGNRVTRLEARLVSQDTVHYRIFPTGSPAEALLRTKAGQHIFINCPSVEPMTMHPFSFVACGRDEGNGSFYIDVYGRVEHGFTARLARKIKTTAGGTYRCMAFVEGPYGHALELRPYDQICLFSAGIGITHCLAGLSQACVTIDDTVSPDSQQDCEGKTNTPHRTISLVWVYRDPETFEVAEIHLKQLEAHLATLQNPPTVLVKAFCTGSTELPLPTLSQDGSPSQTVSVFSCGEKSDRDEKQAQPLEMLQPFLTITKHAGRPELKRELMLACEQNPEAPRTAVVACGPTWFSDLMRSEVAETRVEGVTVDFFDEVFAW